jgi:hypothetical protein
VEEAANTTAAMEEQSDDYAEIRYSQFNHCSTTVRLPDLPASRADDMGACGIVSRKEQNVYDGYDNDCEYSRLQLRRKQSRFIIYDVTQKPEYKNQDEEEYLPLNMSDITSPPLRRAYTLPRKYRVDTDNEHAQCSNDIIRCTSEGQLMEFQKKIYKTSCTR